MGSGTTHRKGCHQEQRPKQARGALPFNWSSTNMDHRALGPRREGLPFVLLEHVVSHVWAKWPDGKGAVVRGSRFRHFLVPKDNGTGNWPIVLGRSENRQNPRDLTQTQPTTTHPQAHLHPHPHTRARAHIHTHTHTQPHHPHTHTHTCKHTPTPTSTNTRTQPHTRAHARTHAHTQTLPVWKQTATALGKPKAPSLRGGIV